ncbi:MAG: hypothetical protein OXT09_25410 [Myxococcales bacterium]|nr:hypothetical protein [Myxococcales bacterium]
MLEELAALAKIAEIDARALATDTELEEIPARMTELSSDVDKLRELLEAEKQDLAEADGLLKTQQDEMKGQSDALARSKAKSARAQTMREVDAVERELEVIRRSMREREEEREKLKAAIDKRRSSVEKHEQEFADLENFTSEEKANAEARLGELNQERSSILAGREELVKKVPGQIIRRYEMIRKKRSGVGAVTVRDGICIGCNTALRPNQNIAIQRHETFEQCPRCNRLLYSPHTIAKAEEAAAGGKDGEE